MNGRIRRTAAALLIAAAAATPALMPHLLSAPKAETAVTAEAAEKHVYISPTFKMTLSTGVTAEEVQSYSNYAIREVDTDPGCILPADCSCMFDGFNYLMNIDFSKADASNVTDMSCMFRGCTSLIGPGIIFGGTTANVRDMTSMFEGCTSLMDYDITGLDLTSLKSMKNMFKDCTDLVSLDARKLETTSLEDMTGMFFGCTQLEDVFFDGFSTDKVKDMHYLFGECTSMKKVDITSFTDTSYPNTNKMFYNCSSLETIIVGDNFENLCGSEMFYGCTSLVGGCGTKYNSSHIGYEYAKKDFPQYLMYGYFTYYNMPSGAYYNDIEKTLCLCGAVTKEQVKEYRDNTAITSIRAMPGCVLPEDCSFFIDGLDTDDLNHHFWKNLASIDLSRADTSNVTKMGSMFSTLYRLKSINLSGFDTSKVTGMSFMFSSCSGLTSLDLSGFDTSSVTTMRCMFQSDYNLKALDLSNFDTSSVTNMERMFANCMSLESLDVSSFDTGNVTTMKEMFFDCEKLQQLDVSSFDTGNVTNFTGMFSKCKALEQIDVRNFDTGNAVYMSLMFGSCEKLTSLDLTGFDVRKTEYMSEMFRNCVSLESVDISSFNTKSLTSIYNMFDGDSKLETIIAGRKWSISKVNLSTEAFKGCESLVGGAGTLFNSSYTDKTYARIDKGTGKPGYFTQTDFEFDPETGTLTLYGNIDPVKLKSYASDTRIKNIVAAEDSVLPANCSNLFARFSAENIDLSKTDSSNVRSLNGMFLLCQNLKSIDLTGFNTSYITSFGSVFYGCKQLTSLDLSSFDTSDATIFSGMFYGCEKLTSLDLSSFDTSKATKTISMFQVCRALKTINVGKYWIMDKVTDDDLMFSGCIALTGQNGTAYDMYKVGKTYARIDAPDQMGYLSSDALGVSFNHNCEFNNNIAMYYAVPKSSLSGYSNLRLVVDKEEYAENAAAPTTKKTVLTKYSETTINSKVYYLFAYTGITSTDMSSNLSVKLYADANGRTYSSALDEYSIKQYAHNRLEKSSSATFKKLLVDMLNYGAAAQINFKKNVNNLANKDLTAAQKKLGTQTMPTLKSCEKTNELSGAKAEFEGKNLTFGNNIILMYKMKFPSGYTMKNVKLKLTYKTSKGESVTKDIPYSKFQKDGTSYIANFDTLAVTDFRSPISAKVYDGSKQISSELIYSVETYVYNRLKKTNSEDFKKLITEMMKYGISAEKHFS